MFTMCLALCYLLGFTREQKQERKLLLLLLLLTAAIY